MRRWGFSLKKTTTILVGTAVGFTLISQNCGQPNMENEDLAAYANTLPFAYDSTINRIAYMSCSGQPSGDPRVFTFRVAGLAGAGLKIRQEFLDQTVLETLDGKLDLLRLGSQNGNINLQLAIRPADNYLNAYTAYNPGVVHGLQFMNFFAGLTLDADEIAKELLEVTNGQRTRLFFQIPDTNQYQKTVFADLRFTDEEYIAKEIRDDLTTDTKILALTYADYDSTIPKSSAATAQEAKRNVYGQGYSVKFTVPRSPLSPNNDFKFITGQTVSFNRVLNSVTEKYLDTGLSSSARWSCNSSLRLIIVNGVDDPIRYSWDATANAFRGTEFCRGQLEATLTIQQRPQWETLREMGVLEDYEVNLNQKCLYPRPGTGVSCYKNFSYPTITKVTYQGGDAEKCQNEAPTNPTAPVYICPHFFSVCESN